MNTQEKPYIWLLSDGKAGHINQLRALAQSMPVDYTELEFNSQDFDSQVLRSKKPDHIFSIARAGKKMQHTLNQKFPSAVSEAKRIHVMARKKPDRLFDCEVIMAHDVQQGYTEKPRQILCSIPPSLFGIQKNDVALDDLGCTRYLTLLLGGTTKAFRFDDKMAFALGQKIQKTLHKQDIGLYISASRRTPEKAISALEAGLGTTPYFLWDNSGDNPYHSMITKAESVMVTEDSMSMLSDIVHAGKPLYIAELKTKFLKTGRKHRRYRDTLIAAGYAKLFSDSCTPFDPPKCTATKDLAQSIMQVCSNGQKV